MPSLVLPQYARVYIYLRQLFLAIPLIQINVENLVYATPIFHATYSSSTQGG